MADVRRSPANPVNPAISDADLRADDGIQTT
jgi:hypothetical protein